MCRNSKMGLLNHHHAVDEQLKTYNQETSHRETKTSLLIKEFFEKHESSRIVLLLVVLLGTSMVIGDGVLTPTMSVLSAVSGISIKVPDLHEDYTVCAACIVLFGLFALQHYGTHQVGFLFAPILLVWLCCISFIGVYNVIKWNPSVVRALSPYYVYKFFKVAGSDGWSSLGGVVLCITGAEAMFADLAHFSKISIRISFAAVVYPSLVLAYTGEAAYLTKHEEDLQASFYKSIPEHIFWPVFIIATSATVVGSQAIISATFSIISQCHALGCFPRVKIIHTSNHIHGQIYIPEINWLLMFLCLAVTIGFKDTHMIGNAYGLAVIIVMFVTTCLMFLIITAVWKRSFLSAIIFLLLFGFVELLYLTACLAKVLHHGGWLPISFSLLTLLAMSVWHYGTCKKQAFELQNKVGANHLLQISSSLGLVRVPGIGLVYTANVTGIPPMFAHFIANFPAFHRICIFVCMQNLTVPRVPLDQQFSVERMGAQEHRLYQCIFRYGYRDARRECFDFENELLMKVAEFLQQDTCTQRKVGGSEEMKEEVKELVEEKEAGVAYMVGQTCVVAHESSSLMKKFAINVVYSFLRRNSRSAAVALGVPHTSLIQVGMVYRV